MKQLRALTASSEWHGSPIDALGLLPQEPLFAWVRRDARNQGWTRACVVLETDGNELVCSPTDDAFGLIESWLADFEVLNAGEFCGGVAALVAHEPADGEGDPVPSCALLRLHQFLVLDVQARRATMVRLVPLTVEPTSVEAELQVLLEQRLNVVRPFVRAGKPGTMGEWNSPETAASYSDKVRAAQDALARSEAQQVILSLPLERVTGVHPWRFFEALVGVNPTPHAYYMRLPGGTLAGCSPLMFLDKRGDQLVVETDAGTRPVGRTEAESRRFETELTTAAKDLHEQALIVQATREDLQKVAEAGEVRTPVPHEVRRFSHVMHLYTVLACTVRASAAAVAKACFPAPAVVGHPRAAAMPIYQQLEGARRGTYGGVIGVFGYDGDIDSAVVLRSAWFQDGRLRLRSGGGIVPASDPLAEYHECFHKAQALVHALNLAEDEATAHEPEADRSLPRCDGDRHR